MKKYINKNIKLQLVWHYHHDVLIEPLIKPFEARVKYIKKSKPKDQQKLRLKLFKTVKGKLPMPNYFVRAYQKWQKADQKWQEAYQKRQKAYQKWYKSNENKILALHKKECPNCPWDGKTIFSKPTN